jgi:hypothetical protein
MSTTHRSTSEDLADPGGVSRKHVLERLRDWRDRVHKLYDAIERELQGSPFRSNREGKHTSSEELLQRVGVTESEQPQIDILRVVRSEGANAAVLYPRGLWIIGWISQNRFLALLIGFECRLALLLSASCLILTGHFRNCIEQ